MAPIETSSSRTAGDSGHVGPHPSLIQVATPYIFEKKIREYLTATGTNPAKEDTARLQGVSWIDDVRRALQL